MPHLSPHVTENAAFVVARCWKGLLGNPVKFPPKRVIFPAAFDGEALV
jgi:hypothetical protein